MARARAFDSDAVLAKAMHLFRRKGFASTSVSDLEHATGLSVGSLYNAFGDKQQIFDAAYEHYNRTVLSGRIARYAPPGSGLSGLRKLFLTLLDEPAGTAYGCLITNSAVEFGGDSHPHTCTTEAWRTLIDRFEESVSPAAATRLLALYQGVLVLFRGGYDKSALRKMITNEFNTMEQ